MAKQLFPKHPLRLFYWRIVVPYLIRRKGVHLGSETKFYGMPIISISPQSTIDIGDRTVICSNSEFTVLGVNHPTIMRTLRLNASIKIGKDCGISGLSICAAQNVEIGNQCLIGANVTIADTDFHPIASHNRRYSDNENEIKVEPVFISNNVFIGAGSFILKGVRIGENSIIGAMSVVTSDVLPDSIYAGNPAKFLKNFKNKKNYVQEPII